MSSEIPSEIDKLMQWYYAARTTSKIKISGLSFSSQGLQPEYWYNSHWRGKEFGTLNRIHMVEKKLKWISEAIDVYEQQFKHIPEIQSSIQNAISFNFESINTFIQQNLNTRQHGDEMKITFELDGVSEPQVLILPIPKLILETNNLLEHNLKNLDLNHHREDLYLFLDKQYKSNEEKEHILASDLKQPFRDAVEKQSLLLLLVMVPNLVRMKDLHLKVETLGRKLEKHGIATILDPSIDPKSSLMGLMSSPMEERWRERATYGDVMSIVPYGMSTVLWVYYPHIINTNYLHWEAIEHALKQNHSFREVMKKFYPYYTYKWFYPHNKQGQETFDELGYPSDKLYHYIEKGIDDKPEWMPDIQNDLLVKLKMPRQLVRYIVFLSGRPRTNMPFIAEAIGRPLRSLQDILRSKGRRSMHGTSSGLFLENGMTFIDTNPDSAVLVNRSYLFKTQILVNPSGIFLPVLRFIKGLLPQDHKPDDVVPEEKMGRKSEEKHVELREIGLYHATPPPSMICGTYYYYEPNSAFLLATSKLLIAPTKLVAAMYLVTHHKQDMTEAVYKELDDTIIKYLLVKNGYLLAYDLSQLFINSEQEYIRMAEKIQRSMLTGEFGEGFLNIEKSPFRMSKLYASEDMFDQPLCNAARSIGIPVILLTCMVGKSRIVSEILDTRFRKDSYGSIVVDDRYLNYHKLQRSQYDDIQLGLVEDYPAFFEDVPRPNQAQSREESQRVEEEKDVEMQ